VPDESGDGVAQADGDTVCEAGGELKDAAFAAGAGEVSGVECGDGCSPVDGGNGGAAAGAVLDEPARKVAAAEERALGGQQRDACFERVDAVGAGEIPAGRTQAQC
jgi:hypothetical protein